MGPFTNDAIHLGLLAKWDKTDCSLISRQKTKIEKCLIIGGGINYYGMSKLIFLHGTMNEFAYEEALLIYKDDIKENEKKRKYQVNI